MKCARRIGMRLLTVVTVLLAVTSLLGGLAGCGGAAPAVTPTPTRTPSPQATAPPEPTAVPEPTATPLPTATPTVAPDVNPLTGEVVDNVSRLERVPVAIKVSNWPGQYVRPQAGIDQADLIFEHYNEGWNATRWTAIYLGRDAERVGPVRSGRLIDLELPAIYKAVFACWGFSNGVLAIFLDSDLYPDQLVSNSIGRTLAPSPFYRDYSRDVPLEHTGYTSPELVRVWAEEHGFTGRQDLQGMVFSQGPTVEGEPAATIRIPWRGHDAEWRYDQASQRYLRWSDGVPHTDALTGEQLSAANVVVLYVPQWNTGIVEEPHSGALSIQFALWNSNRAIVFRDGVQIEAFWQRWERDDMLILTDEEGSTIPLKVGNTFFEVLPAPGDDYYFDIIIE
jgi:hypothetical protein